MMESSVAIHWFRKGLRIHDNPALIESCRISARLYPVFCIDPHFAKPDVVGINRYAFLLESLHDLDISLRELGSRLYVVKGKPEDQLPLLIENWNVNFLTFEKDTEPYAQRRDRLVEEKMISMGVQVKSFTSHTLFDPNSYITKNKGSMPTSYGTFCKIFNSMGKPRAPLPAPCKADIPPISLEDEKNHSFDVPTLEEMGYANLRKTSPFVGGESEALRRLKEKISDRPAWAASFEKPNTSPNSLEASTTVQFKN